MLPILHLNGYKIANPTVLAPDPRERAGDALRGLRLGPDRRLGRLRRRGAGAGAPALRRRARPGARRDRRDPGRRASGDEDERPRWPMIVLRTPKGWTGPREVDGVPVEGTWRSHQVPLAGVRDNAEQRSRLEEWLRSYRPGGAVRRGGPPAPGARRARAGRRPPHERQPARERRRAAARPRAPGLPRLRRRGPEPATTFSEATRVLGGFLRDVVAATVTTSASSARTRRASNRLGDVFDATDKAWVAETTRGRAPRPDGRVLEILSEHLCQGWLEGYLLTAARPLQLLRGLHPHRRLDVQPAREVAEGDPRTSPGGGRSPRSTTCSARTSGGRTTTASRTRIPASSTTSSTRRRR